MPGNDRDDLALLIAAAQKAGDIALRHFAGDRTPTEKPGGQGPVTEADLEVNEALETALRAARPDYGWLSEETPDTADRLARSHAFIIDPIDGTRAFVEGNRAWAHSIAIARNGQVTAAVVYLPAQEKLFAAEAGHGATLNGSPIAVDPGADEEGEILASRPNFDPRHWPGGVTPLRRTFRSSLANRLALVAEARFAAMLSIRDVWEWDVAAGTLIATEAGAAVSTVSGGEPVFNTPGAMLPGILAAPPALHGRLHARLNSDRA